MHPEETKTELLRPGQVGYIGKLRGMLIRSFG